MSLNKGKLYIVSTPIGNLKDITFRAIETLKEVDIIACEDTRVAKKLLNRYKIEKKHLISYYEPVEEKIIPKIINLLKEGKNIALISDAGTPTLSDPGYKLVKEAIKENIEVISIPGAFAAVVALSVSGLPTDKFIFLGFLPTKESKKREILDKFGALNTTIIIYESPHKLLKTVSLIKEIFPKADIVIAKELTKIHEKFIRGSIDEVIKYLNENPEIIKGEFVILLYPNNEVEKPSEEKLLEEAKSLKEKGIRTKEIAKKLSKKYNLNKNEVYTLIIKELENS